MDHEAVAGNGGAQAGAVTAAERAALAAWDEPALGMLMARRYYLADQSKVAIARDLGVSRFQVARLLADARRHGTVRIEIGSPGHVDRELGAALAERLGLERAVVVDGGEGGAVETGPAVRHVAGALADVLRESVREGQLVGLTWSRAIETMSWQLDRLAPCTVVQLAGALLPTGERTGSVETVRRVAAVGGGTARPVYAPLVVGDAATATGLARQPEIAAVLELAGSLDLAVVSVGAWRPSASAVFDEVDPATRAEVTAAGGCGEISGRVVAADGASVVTSLDERVVGVTADQLRAAGRLVATSYGAHRAEATVAAVRAGFVTTLVADADLARAILDGGGAAVPSRAPRPRPAGR